MSQPPAGIEVRGLATAYGDHRVLRGVELRVDPGELVVLAGANGAGKTTTVETIAGFRRPDGGTVRVGGCDPWRQRDAVVVQLGVMLQEGGAYQAATPREVVRLVAAFYADPLDPDGLLERVGLAGRAARTRVRRLSGGQKQRLNLALALVGRPRVLLLDEPTAGMDPAARQEMRGLLTDLRADGVAALVTTHDLAEVEVLADRVAVLAGGRIVADGTPTELAASHGGDGLEVIVRGDLDAAALADHLGVDVARIAAGRWHVAGGAELIGPVSAWAQTAGVEVRSLTAGGGLEAALVALAGAGDGHRPDQVESHRRPDTDPVHDVGDGDHAEAGR